MSDHVNKKILLAGAGQMAVDYYKVLKALSYDVTVVGRSEVSAAGFKEKTGVDVVTGGLGKMLSNEKTNFYAAIVAVGMEELMPATLQLLNYGIKSILVEKPAGLNDAEISELASTATKLKANVFVGYNRRFYSSVRKAREIIEMDGGVTSFNFEFTEWSHVIAPLEKAPGVKENWLLANSSHVIDLAFFLGGKPQTMISFASGKLSWHNKAVFSGAGRTDNDVLFSYQSNWAAPGRWGIEILTSKSRLILRPLEDLQIQSTGSVAINMVEIDKEVDTQFKPGLFLQTQSFLNGDWAELKSIREQASDMSSYNQVALGNVNIL